MSAPIAENATARLDCRTGRAHGGVRQLTRPCLRVQGCDDVAAFAHDCQHGIFEHAQRKQAQHEATEKSLLREPPLHCASGLLHDP